MKLKAAAITITLLLLSACSDNIEVSGHTYASVLIQLNTYDDIELFNKASFAMADGVMTEKESKEFFDYAIDNLAPITMAPVYREVDLFEAYPVTENRERLLSFFQQERKKY